MVAFWFLERWLNRKYLSELLANLPFVFISYRRKDAKVVAESIHKSLELSERIRFVFRDVEDLPYGKDFDSQITGAIQASSVVFFLVGDKWTAVKRNSEDNLPAYLHPDDWIKKEFELAESLQKPIVPVLLDIDSPPALTGDEPDWIRRLFKLNALKLRSDTCARDVAEMAKIARNEVHQSMMKSSQIERMVRFWDYTNFPRLLSSCILLFMFVLAIYQIVTMANVPERVANLENSRSVFPFSLDEFGAGNISAIDTFESLIITDVVLNEVSMEQIVFSTVEEQHREAKIVIREPSAVLREDLQAYTNKKVRVQIRSTGGVGEVITATTIDKWWPLAN